jgi:Ca2+-binding RTX toxin-like protein
VSYANWGFKVSDGKAVSTSAYNMTVNVTAVRDDLTKTGTSGNDTLSGDTIDAGSYDYLIGLAGSDTLSGLAGNDTLDGGTGNDTLNGGTGADSMMGGDGSDTYDVDNTGDQVVESNATASTGGTDLVWSYLSAYTLSANVENGRIMATGAANLTGNGLNNLLFAGAGNNVINGSTGTDTLSYLYASAAVTLDLSATTAQATGGSGSDTVSLVENLTGSKYNDKLTGSSGVNLLDGGTGNDTLNGGTGADSMTGGDGSDTYDVDNTGDRVVESNATASTGGTDLVLSSLSAYTLGANVENGRIMASGAANLTGNSLNNLLFAGAGNNVINGGTGTDTLSYLYASAAVTLDLSAITAQATGGSGSDTVSLVENLTGSSYNDRLTGNSVANRLDGGSGNDTLSGGAGNDVLVGGAGIDVLAGGAGKDSLTGGTGNDFFDFNALSELGLGSTARDVITDFTVGQDKIDLSTIDARSALTGDQAFTFVSSFTTTAGQVRYSGGIVYLNTDTDTAAEFEIQLTGTVPASLTAASFVL